MPAPSPTTRRPIKEAAAEFLAVKRIAVTGVSRSGTDHGANVVYKRLRERGYDVVAVNPNAATVEGDPSYADLTSIAAGVDGVVIGTAPSHAAATIDECIALGIGKVWFHRGPGGGSVDQEAIRAARAAGIDVIDGGCPCMFGPTADTGHKVMRPFLQLTGNVPRKV